ncbi:unnamed protein product [Paramecium octaurelia]|uniref:Uncharacterized protein n=1 Tax=Paramecium octaurelia TaxID=43137 RepID=A0A8S1USF7_PAROT|nr:unnamed protein product [Paramecium octaurelia]
MLDRRSQSPIATSQRMGTARAIFDTGPEPEPTKRLTRSIRNTSTEQKQAEQKQMLFQYGGVSSLDMNSPNVHQYPNQQANYQSSEMDTYRTSQVYKPIEVNAQSTSQFNYQSIDYQKPQTGSFIQTAYINKFQEPQGSVKNYQSKTTYEVPKPDTKYQMYDFDKIAKQEKPKVYEKFEPYKFEPLKYDQFEKIRDVQSSQRSIPQPNHSIIQTSNNPFPQDRITLDTQFNRSSMNLPSEQVSLSKQKINESFQQQEIVIQNQKPSEQILYKSNYKVPSEREESVKMEYRPTTPVQTQSQQQQSIARQSEDQLYRQEPIEINFKPSYGEPQRKYEDEYAIIENEANEHEFNAGCLIF